MKKRIQHLVSNFYPPAFRKNIKNMLFYSFSKQTWYEFIGNMFFLSIITFFITFILLKIFIEEFTIVHTLIAITTIGVVHFSFYIILYLKTEKINDSIEATLPDVLQVISSNLDAGSTPYQAMSAATKDEFGVLGKLFDKATKKALASESFVDALREIAQMTNSEIFKRAIKLMISSLQSGGHLSKLLQELAEDISDRHSLKEEMVTNTKTYTMFIMFTIIMGAPLLFAISIHFVTVVNNLQSTASLQGSEFGLGFLAGGIAITAEFLTKIAFTSLLVISFVACGMMGVITSGKARLGVKYAPVLIGGSIIMFFIAKRIILSMFGSML